MCRAVVEIMNRGARAKLILALVNNNDGNGEENTDDPKSYEMEYLDLKNHEKEVEKIDLPKLVEKDLSASFEVDELFQNKDLYESAPPSALFSPKRIPPSVQPPHSAPLPNDQDRELITLEDLLLADASCVHKNLPTEETPTSPYSNMSGIEAFSSPVRDFSDSSASWYPDSEEDRLQKNRRHVFVRSSSESSDSEYVENPKRKKNGKVVNETQSQSLDKDFDRRNVSNTAMNPGTTSNHLQTSETLPENAIPDLTVQDFSKSVTEELSISATTSKIQEPSRWKKGDPTKWKKNLTKTNRHSCLPYQSKTGKLMSAKKPKPVKCETKCRYQCLSKITDDDRLNICQDYWKIQDFVAQKQFLLHLIIAMPIKTYKIGIPEQKHRSVTYEYYFYKNGSKERVCKDFFLKTLCISNGPVIQAFKQKHEFGNYAGRDNRGSRDPINKTDMETEERVIDHINSFPRLESHYCRKKSKRQYLDSKLSIAKMFQLYKEKMASDGIKSCSFYVYKNFFGSKFNLSFFTPKKDLCMICTRYNTADKPDNLKDEYDAHIVRKNEAQAAKDADKQRSIIDDTYLVVTADMQSTLHIPVSGVGILYYTRKLNVQNYTIHTAKPPNEAYCMTWNETNGKRGSNEIASAINWWISQVPTNIKEIVMYSDTCAGQNRNQFITAFLAHLIQRPDVRLEVIEQKYLESGHTHMEVDSMHSAIEKEQRHTPVYSMIDWKSIMHRARSKRHRASAPPYVVQELTYDQMIDVRTLNEKFGRNTSKDQEGKAIKWLKIKCLRYEKQFPGVVKFRYTHDGPYAQFDLFQEKKIIPRTRKRLMVQRGTETDECEISDQRQTWLDQLKAFVIPKAYLTPLPISEAKKKDLTGLCAKGIIPQELHTWYQSLPTSKDIIDTLPEPDITEEDPEVP